MKCVCEQECFVANPEGKPQHFTKGMVMDFKKCPTHFRPVKTAEKGTIDFATAGEEELREAEYELDDLKEYIRQTYDKNPANRGREKTVDMLLDCRYRVVDTAEINRML